MTYLLFATFVFKLLGSNFRKHVLGDLIAQEIGLSILPPQRLCLGESILELLTVATKDLLMQSELGLEVGSTFDRDGSLHKHSSQSH